MAAASLPLAVKARSPKLYNAATYRSTNKGVAGETLYGITIIQSAVENFSAATQEEKTISMAVKYYRSTERTSPSQAGDYNLIMESVKKESEDLWTVKTRVEKITSSYDLPKSISKKMTLKLKKMEYIHIEGKKAPVAELIYIESGSGDEDCFLTTACVQHKQLPDNCKELETLRGLRDQHMRTESEGIELIEQYDVIGPAIVKGINSCQNKAQIYDYMYAHMIVPSVLLVQQGKNDEAVNYYKTFVKALHEKYC